MAIHKKKKSADAGRRFLASVSVMGSAGPLRFVVNEGVTAGVVADNALRAYAKEGRRPVLGSNKSDFLLYHANAGAVLKPWETVSSHGSRNFVLCKKDLLHPAVLASGAAADDAEQPAAASPIGRKSSGGIFKSWFSVLKISSH